MNLEFNSGRLGCAKTSPGERRTAGLHPGAGIWIPPHSALVPPWHLPPLPSPRRPVRPISRSKLVDATASGQQAPPALRRCVIFY